MPLKLLVVNCIFLKIKAYSKAALNTQSRQFQPTLLTFTFALYFDNVILRMDFY